MARLGARKILLLTRYDQLGASSRIRFLQFLPALRAQGFDFDVRPFFGEDYIRKLYAGGRITATSLAQSYWHRFVSLIQRREYDLIWLEKEAMPWIPFIAETGLLRGVPYLVDLDDAWFHRYGLLQSTFLRSLLGGKIDAIMRQASVVVVGNDYLADRARQAGSMRIVHIPSVIDLDRYPREISISARQTAKRPVVVGWIGTPVTASYLTSVEPALRTVANETGATLRIVGAKPPPAFKGINVESVAWDETTEIQNILGMDIGIMPLADTPWEKGKCAYKLLQIMAAGRPVVASPVGANCKVVQHGKNGFLANSTEEWAEGLRRLIYDGDLRQRLGIEAYQTVKKSYSVQIALPLIITALESAMDSNV